MSTRPSPRLVALLAAVLLLPLIVVAGLAVSAGAGFDVPGSAGPVSAAASDGHCQDGSPVSACHPRSEFPAPAPGAAPRPDLDTAWGVPGHSAARAVPRPGVPDDPAPDLIALSISRT